MRLLSYGVFFVDLFRERRDVKTGRICHIIVSHPAGTQYRLKLNRRYYNRMQIFGQGEKGEMQVSQKQTKQAPKTKDGAEKSGGVKDADRNTDERKDVFIPDKKEAGFENGGTVQPDEYESFRKKYAERIENERNLHVRKSCEKAVRILSKLDSMLNILAVRYSVNPGDIDGIVRGVMTDPAMNEGIVTKRGCTIEQMTRMDALERENSMLREQATEFYKLRRNEEMFAEWERESDKIRKLYDPEFDLKNEIASDPEFLRLLKSGVSADSAYYLRHKESIDSSAAKKMSEAFAQNVRARGMRPNENGSSNISAASFGTDMKNLSKKAREDIRRKVKAGEKNYF